MIKYERLAPFLIWSWPFLWKLSLCAWFSFHIVIIIMLSLACFFLFRQPCCKLDPCEINKKETLSVYKISDSGIGKGVPL